MDKPLRKVSSVTFCGRTRLIILILTLICMSLLQMNSLAFNFTVICMSDIVEDFQSANVNETHWFENPNQKSLIFSSMAIGGLTGLIVSVPIMHKLGDHLMLTICGIFSTLGTILFPLAVSWNYEAVLLARFAQGLGISLVFSALGTIPIAWAPTKGSSRFLAALSCAFQLSNVICTPIAGILCDSTWGWRSVYYVFGSLTAIFFTIFAIFYRDSPRSHRNVSHKELEIIEEDKIITKRQKVPYRELCTDICVLVTWLSNLGGNLGVLTLLLYGPTYLREVLHFEVKGTGFASALPFFLAVLVKSIAGQLSDKCTFVSEKTRFVICGCAARFGLGIGYFFMATTTNRTIAQIAFTSAIAISGLNVMGSVKCLQLRCKQHVHFAISAIAIMAYIIQFGAPIIVGMVCPDNTPEQWSTMFLVVGVIVVVTTMPFPFFTTSEAAEYTKNKEIS